MDEIVSGFRHDTSPLHLQNSVHDILDFEHEHRADLHAVVQLQQTNFSSSSGAIKVSDGITVARSKSPSTSHPYSKGSMEGGSGIPADFQIAV